MWDYPHSIPYASRLRFYNRGSGIPGRLEAGGSIGAPGSAKAALFIQTFVKSD
jgi:hypothetical protein